MDVDIDKILRFRFWVRHNFEWLIGEVIFHREMKQYFRNQMIPVWKFDSQEGRANVYEIT